MRLGLAQKQSHILRQRFQSELLPKERHRKSDIDEPGALRGAAAGGHLLRSRSWTMSPHRLRRGALHLPTRRSRQNVNLFLREPLVQDSISMATYFGDAEERGRTRKRPEGSSCKHARACLPAFFRVQRIRGRIYEQQYLAALSHGLDKTTLKRRVRLWLGRFPDANFLLREL